MTDPTDEAPGGAPAGAPGFSIAVPGDWIIIDVDRTQDQGLVGELVQARVADGTLAAESQDEAVAIVVRLIAEAERSGVRFAAALVHSDDAGPLIVSVTLSVARLDVPDLSELAGERDGDDIEVRLGGTAPAPVEPETKGSGIAVSQTATSQVVLPAGPAVRIERVMSTPKGELLSQDVYAVQYVLPIDEDGLTFTFTGVSPAIRRKRELDRVFAEIVDTIRIDR